MDPLQTDYSVQKSINAFRTISEVAAELNVPQHVLRFWESKFTQIKPLKRAGGRRYYRPDDVNLLRGIRGLLYGEGYTIKGVQKLLKERGPRFVSGAMNQAEAVDSVAQIIEKPPVAEDVSRPKANRNLRRPQPNPDEIPLPILLPELVRPGMAADPSPTHPKAVRPTRINPAQRRKLEQLLAQLCDIQQMLENP
ncbi:MAG TPA: MerR family transcriptional regulator [Alphaproteobacteria bacterium]|nr:MerR family transcriptional regulator [Alphaproteobacteria bacterium]